MKLIEHPSSSIIYSTPSSSLLINETIKVLVEYKLNADRQLLLKAQDKTETDQIEERITINAEALEKVNQLVDGEKVTARDGII